MMLSSLSPAKGRGTWNYSRCLFLPVFQVLLDACLGLLVYSEISEGSSFLHLTFSSLGDWSSELCHSWPKTASCLKGAETSSLLFLHLIWVSLGGEEQPFVLIRQTVQPPGLSPFVYALREPSWSSSIPALCVLDDPAIPTLRPGKVAFFWLTQLRESHQSCTLARPSPWGKKTTWSKGCAHLESIPSHLDHISDP